MMVVDARKSHTLAYIDAIRGVAILGVVALHCAQAVPASNICLQYAMLVGVRGVQLFYVASAITLCMSWHRRSGQDLRPTRNYLLRRFWRIAPLFYLAIGGYLLLDGWGPRMNAPNGIRGWFVPVTIMIAHGWHPETINGIVPGSWSIAVEFIFYAVLPAIMSCVTTPQRSVMLVALALVTAIANDVWMPRLWTPMYPENQLYLVKSFTFFNFLSQLPVFAIGITAYFAIRDGTVRGIVANLTLAAFASGLSLWLRGTDVSVLDLAKNYLVFSAGLAAIVVLLARKPLVAFVNPLTLFLGKVSYGIYLIHFAVIEVFSNVFASHFGRRGDVQSIAFFLMTLSVATLLAFAANKVVEEPGIALGKRIIARGEARERQKR
jgi:peptidoglycan/LPS O-acetylase OafA/YrhL